jgi:hypothetical protein
MSCRTDACTQGRQPCPTPWVCGHGMRRVEPAALNQTNGGEEIDTAPVTAEGTIGATGETFIGLCFIAAVSVIGWLAWTNWELLATAFGWTK